MGDLSIQNLVVEYYSGGYALRPINGLNLDVAAGSLVMLLGPSGCGKTTLLSCLGGILRPKSGAIQHGTTLKPVSVEHLPSANPDPSRTRRHLGDRDYAALALREEYRQKTTVGPELVVSGPPLTRSGGHCWFLGGVADSVEELVDAVQERAARGADWDPDGRPEDLAGDPHAVLVGRARRHAAAAFELANYRRNKVGIVFQAFNLVPSLTAVENVMVPLRSAGMSRRASRRRAEDYLQSE